MSLKKIHTVVAVVAIAGLSGLAYWWQHRPLESSGAPAKVAGGRGGSPAAAPGAGGPVAVEAGRVEVQALAEDAQAVGTLRARQSVVLRPEVSGRIVKLGFTDGQRVRRGQVLIQLDDSLQAAQLQQAEAQAGIARTQLQRNRELLAQNFVSPSVVDQAQAALQVAEAQVALNRAQLERMAVRSPFDGVAGIRTVNLGDYVKDGSDLVSVEDASTMWVDFRLPERYVPRLKIGQAIELGLDALPGRAFGAQIEALDTQLEANGRSLLVRLSVRMVPAMAANPNPNPPPHAVLALTTPPRSFCWPLSLFYFAMEARDDFANTWPNGAAAFWAGFVLTTVVRVALAGAVLLYNVRHIYVRVARLRSSTPSCSESINCSSRYVALQSTTWSRWKIRRRGLVTSRSKHPQTASTRFFAVFRTVWLVGH